MKQLPNTVIGMIEELEELYPARCKHLKETTEEHDRYAGAVELVTNLRGRFEAAYRAEKSSLPTVIG